MTIKSNTCDFKVWQPIYIRRCITTCCKNIYILYALINIRFIMPTLK